VSFEPQDHQLAPVPLEANDYFALHQPMFMLTTQQPLFHSGSHLYSTHRRHFYDSYYCVAFSHLPSSLTSVAWQMETPHWL